jgi:hypothetical protein
MFRRKKERPERALLEEYSGKGHPGGEKAARTGKLW